MSGLIRSPKSGSNWTVSELRAYSIVVLNQSVRTFFGRDLSPIIEYIDPDFLTADVASELDNDESNRLLTYLDLASRANAGQESAIHDFTKELLRILSFEERSLVLRSRYEIPLQICGEQKQAQIDICLVHRTPTILLIIQGCKDQLSGDDPEAQVIAGAIAAFQLNNRNRGQLGLDRRDTMSIPCITMIGTRPVFYVVSVTDDLSMAVETGRFPEHRTQVRKCVVEGTRSFREGMDNLDFRLEALMFFTLFRVLAKSLWSEFLI